MIPAELIQKTISILPSRNFHDHYRLGEIIGRFFDTVKAMQYIFVQKY